MNGYLPGENNSSISTNRKEIQLYINYLLEISNTVLRENINEIN